MNYIQKQNSDEISSARRKDIYKKSKYYQEKRQKLLIATGIGIFDPGFYTYSGRYSRMQQLYAGPNRPAAKNTVSMNASGTTTRKLLRFSEHRFI